MIARIKDDPASFYGYARKFTKLPSQVGPLQVEGGNHTNDDEAMAEILRKHYDSMFSVPTEQITPDSINELFQLEEESSDTSLTHINFSEENVKAAVASLSNSAAPGPDGVPTLCYKRGGHIVTRALQSIFQESMDTGQVDSSMKKAFITPIWKGGDRTLAVSYRPVSLTTHLSKVQERLIRAPMVDYLESHGLMDSTQHGARAGRSTLSQLLVQYDRVLRLLEDGDNCEVVYLDFSKAFDKVDHWLLLLKLKKLGITGKLGRWLGNFLYRRLQAVRVGSRVSSWAHVVSGTPQGSVLGPLLFLVFISDLGMDLGPESSTILKYVDDTKLIKGVSCPEDVEALQEDLEHLYSWQRANNMDWNASKFLALRMGANSQLRESTLLFTPDTGEPIAETEEARDLGILMDTKGSFRPQRAKASAKAKQKAGWVLRTFRTREARHLKTLWRSLIQPHQDHASQLWAAVGLSGDLLEQEAPLRSFTRRMREVRHLPYWERLARVGLQSSERRQERYRILYTWKILKGMVPNCGLSVDSSPESRRGRTLTIPPLSGSRAAVRSLKERAFQTEGPRLFNSLPLSLRNMDSSYPVFKAHLDVFLAEIPDHPAVPGNIPEAQDVNGRPSNSIKDWMRRGVAAVGGGGGSGQRPDNNYYCSTQSNLIMRYDVDG